MGVGVGVRGGCVSISCGYLGGWSCGIFFLGGVCVGGRVVGEVWACGGRGVGLYS